MFNLGDEVHVLEEKDNMYFIKKYTVTNIIHRQYYELSDGEKQKTISVDSNNIFKDCDLAFKERNRRIKNKQVLVRRNKIIQSKIKQEQIRKQQNTKVQDTKSKPVSEITVTQIGKSTIKNYYSKQELKELALRVQERILEKRYAKNSIKSYSKRNNNPLMQNSSEKKFVEYKPPKRRYNPRYDGDVKVRPIHRGIKQRVRVIKNASGAVIKVEKY